MALFFYRVYRNKDCKQKEIKLTPFHLFEIGVNFE